MSHQSPGQAIAPLPRVQPPSAALIVTPGLTCEPMAAQQARISPSNTGTSPTAGIAVQIRAHQATHHAFVTLCLLRERIIRAAHEEMRRRCWPHRPTRSRSLPKWDPRRRQGGVGVLGSGAGTADPSLSLTVRVLRNESGSLPSASSTARQIYSVWHVSVVAPHRLYEEAERSQNTDRATADVAALSKVWAVIRCLDQAGGSGQAYLDR